LLEDGCYDCWLNLPGSYLSGLSTSRCHNLVSYLSDRLGFRCTRFDIALDDFERRVDAATVVEAIENGHGCRFRNSKVITSRSGRGTPSTTVYMGARRKVVRFYDAEAVHGIPADRWELQLRERRAGSFCRQYVEEFSLERYKGQDGVLDGVRRSADIERFLAAAVVGSVDFRDSSTGDKNIDRRSRLDWWASLCFDVGAEILIHVPKEPVTFRRTLDWADKQIAPTLATIRAGWGKVRFGAWLSGLLAYGDSRMGPRHDSLAESLRRGYGAADALASAA
jgi:hypothetical protein